MIGGPSEPTDATDADAFDDPCRDGGIDMQLDDEPAASYLVDQCEGSPDDGLGTQPSDGEFDTTCVAIQPEGNITDTDPTAPGEDFIGPEPADAMDTDAFEALMQGTIHSAVTIPNQHIGDGTLGVFEGPTTQEMAQTIPLDVPNAETSPTVIIDHFPSGSAGAPIPGVPQGPLARELDQATAAESAWAPFNSECDWKFAHWAKTRGPTSSAVTDLLAIEEVCMLFELIASLLIHH